MLILHLSDIHFSKSEIGTAQDPNFHLRNELIRDAKRQCQQLGRPDVILISGDIAFAGHPEEFTYATDWLETLCSECGCAMSSIFVVPGNHDVVRNIADGNLTQMVHEKIKHADDLEYEIRKQLSDPKAARLLYESLDNYNEFAFQFFCDLMPPDRTLARRDLKLNDGSILRLWGLNTTFISSSKDKQRDLFVDPASFQIPNEDGVTNLVLAHHHLSWLRQEQELEDHLNDVARIQIFGHVHTNRVVMERDYVRLAASAANPERRDKGGWEPGYNFIKLLIDGKVDKRNLKVQVHARVWQTGPSGFRAKMDKFSDVFEHSIKLDPWAPPTFEILNSGKCSNEDLIAERMPTEGGNEMIFIRDLALRFYRLSFSQKSEIAGRLELLEDEDKRLPDFERFRRVFIRAHERGIMDALAEAVLLAEKH